MLGVLLKKLMEMLKVYVLPYYKIVKEFVKTKGFTALVALGFGSILLLMGIHLWVESVSVYSSVRTQR
jgi:hypothetical protein